MFRSDGSSLMMVWARFGDTPQCWGQCSATEDKPWAGNDTWHRARGGSPAINSAENFSSGRGRAEERQGAREPSSLIAMATVHRDGELRGLGDASLLAHGPPAGVAAQTPPKPLLG